MAKSGAFLQVNSMEKSVECKICSERMVNPKELICRHSYCKNCIEESFLDFDWKSGGYYVRCPQDCKEVDYIRSNQTANDLKTPAHLQNVIGYLEDKEKKKEKENEKEKKCRPAVGPVSYTCESNHITDCPNPIYYYCLHCRKKMCKECTLHVLHGHGNHYVPIKLKRSKWSPWCETHRTYAMYECRGRFVCTYCFRSYEFTPATCQEFRYKAEEVRARMKGTIPTFEHDAAVIDFCHRKSAKEIDNVRSILITEVNIRKQEAMKKYLKKLTEEGEEIMWEFESLASNHLTSLMSENKPAHERMEMYINSKSDFELYLDVDDISRKVYEMNMNEVDLPSMSVQFPKDSINESTPLGKISSDYGTVIRNVDSCTVTHEIDKVEVTNERLDTLLTNLNVVTSSTRGLDHAASSQRNNGDRADTRPRNNGENAVTRRRTNDAEVVLPQAPPLPSEPSAPLPSEPSAPPLYESLFGVGASKSP